MPSEPIDIERLYETEGARAYAFAFRMLGDRDEALDAVQDAFAAALAHAEEFRGEAAPATWLLSIVRNVCLGRLRRGRGRTFGYLEAVIEAVSPASTYEEAERRVYVAEVKEGCLIGLLQCLSPDQRCAFVLHLLNGLSVAEVARVMERSDNAVRVLVSRARSAMRRFLCANCALMGGSRCTCENMIEFSLKRGLIERYRPGMTAAVRDELRRFSDEVELYRSLPAPEASIAGVIASGRFRVLGG